jgi:hypothetical protein
MAVGYTAMNDKHSPLFKTTLPLQYYSVVLGPTYQSSTLPEMSYFSENWIYPAQQASEGSDTLIFRLGKTNVKPWKDIV